MLEPHTANLCRLCYEREAKLDIFQSESGLFSLKLKHCCGNVLIEKDDGLPQLICNDCELELDSCYRFVLRCEATDRRLRALLISGRSREVSPKTEVAVEVKSEEVGFSDDCNDSDDRPIIDVKSEFLKPGRDDDAKKRHHKQRTKLWKQDLCCSICRRKCPNLSTLNVHMRTHTNERPYPCHACDKKYKDGGTLKRHIERNHMEKRDRNFICELCGKGFYSKSDVIIHMRVHTKETPYACNVCPARFTQMCALLRHSTRHSKSKAHTCSTCSKSFWTKEELKKHFLVHDDSRKFSCQICSGLFKHKGSLQKHMLLHSKPNMFICNHCGKSFNNKGNLKSHMERRHSERAGICNVCFKSVSNIEMHMWRHTGHRPHACALCPATFTQVKGLTQHINFKHKKTDRFKCTVEGCTQSFPSNPMLVFHVAKHHNHSTPYSCQRCSRGFYRKSDLARHMIGTHKERLQS